MMPPPPPPERTPLGVQNALKVEFEQMWENTSDLDDDDLERMRE
jgi:hypothetical protein